MQKDEYELGKKYIPKSMVVELFEDEKILTEGLKVKKIGGHSVGSCIVLCYCNDKEYVFCGDECYVQACLERKIPTGCSYAPTVSETFVNEYGKGEYKLLLFHDPDIMKGKLGCFPIQTMKKQWSYIDMQPHCFFVKNKKGYFIQKIVEKKKMSFGMMKVRNSRLAKVHCERIKFKKGIDKNV